MKTYSKRLHKTILTGLLMAFSLRCSYSVDVVTKDHGSPADYAPVPDLKALQTWLQHNRNLAAQGKLTATDILADNAHNARVASAPALIHGGASGPLNAAVHSARSVATVAAIPQVKLAGINFQYEPWAIWVTGNNLANAAYASVSIAGTFPPFGTTFPVTVASDGSFASFQLKDDLFLNKCNEKTSCDVTINLVDKEGNWSNQIKLTLPVPPSKTAVPTAAKAGVNTDYEPWAIWVTGDNLINAVSASVSIAGTFPPVGDAFPLSIASDGSFASFQLKNDLFLGKCNEKTTCDVTINLIGKDGNWSNQIKLTLPMASQKTALP